MDRKKWIAGFCILLGIVIMAVPACLRLGGEKRTQELMEEFEQKMESVDEETQDENSKSEKRRKASAIPEGENVIGIIEIESLGIRYPIIEGTGSDALNSGIGHISDTAGIGESGNCVLCGHNGSRHGTFFTSLSGIKTGAVVELTDEDGYLYDYKVTETKVVDPHDNSIKDTDGTERLTLFTCANKGTMRFVCFCEPLESDLDEN